MESEFSPVLDLPRMLSKEASQHHPSPPPAYSRQPRFDTSPSLASRTGPHCQPVLLDRSSLASHVTSSQQAMDADDGTYSDDAQQSSISLRINTSVRVSSNNNHVCINETPAEHANAISRAVVHAIQENSSGRCGIPMVDEDGRPRPLSIEVDAGIEVHGQGNVVGSETFVTEVLRQKQWQQVLRRRWDGDDDSSPPPSAKRRRRSQ